MRLRGYASVTTILVLLSAAFLRYFTNLFFDRTDPQGQPSYFCDKENFLPVRGGVGKVVTYHTTRCDYFGSDKVTYVYLHSLNEHDKSANLILRYEGGDPEITWINAYELKISALNVVGVSKEVSRLNETNIVFSLIPTSTGLSDKHPQRTFDRP